MSSSFPSAKDVFKTIPTPTLTATSLSDATDDTLSTRLQQHSDSINAVQGYLLTLVSLYGIDSGTANAYVISPSFGNPTGYSAGMQVTFSPANTNTGSCTINVNGIGVVPLTNPANIALSGGEINQGSAITAFFDGTRFRIVGQCTLSSALSSTVQVITVECAGYTALAIQCIWTGTPAGLTLSLTHLAQGVPVFLTIINGTSTTKAFGMNASQPNGTAFSIINSLQGASSTGGTAVSLITTGVSVGSGLIMTFQGSCVQASGLTLTR